MRVGFLKPQGTFGWYMATRHGMGGDLIGFSSHADIIQAVVQGQITRGIIARENSTIGAVTDSAGPLVVSPVGIEYQCVAGKFVTVPGKAMICGEDVLPVSQCLYALKGVDWQKAQVVFSHQQALEQCRGFLARIFPGIRVEPAASTVAGVERLSEYADPAVAIAPPWAKDLYPDAVIVQAGIQDSFSNATRFVVLAETDAEQTGYDRTSLYFHVPGDEKPGSLVRVLNVFAGAGLNMRCIESRPANTVLGQYGFFVDLDGHRLDPILSTALQFIVTAGLTTSLRVLGSYPRQNGRNA
jgi:prephenate dehydratase